jgi:predicted TIM-barrel fold metal-dependent hydrolase
VQLEDMVLISVDDHVIEPPDLFDGRLPAKWRDRAPRVVNRSDGSDVWLFEGEVVVNLALAAVAGRPPEDYGMNPAAFAELRPGCYDVDERVRDMDANGVLASLCFPTFPQFCGQLFARHADKDLSLAVIRAYNDWHIEGWAGAHPGRFIPLAVLPLWNAEAMADEVRRVAKAGCRAVTFSENPEKLGLPSFHDERWDPFWRACVDEGTIVCVHIGSSSSMPVTSVDAPADVSIAVTPINLFMASADLLWSRVFREFPDLKIALSEGGIGWIPYFMERADYVHARQRFWTGADFGGSQPSEVFRRNFVTCFIDDRLGLRVRDEVGVETICWECDYPHSDSTWPRSPEVLWESLEGLTDEEIDAITHRNAMRIFGFDPFPLSARDEVTVGALRARAADVDLTPRSYGEPKVPTAPIPGI